MIRTLVSEPSDYSYVADEGTGSPSDDYREFEFVLNPKHLIAVSFVVLIVVALVAGGSYFVGRTSSMTVSANTQAAGTSVAVAASSQTAPQAVAPAAVPSPVAAAPAAAPVPELAAPIFQSPVPKALYIQIGAVEKGIAVIMAEGLRDHALPAFAAAGPSTNIYRVLVGPLDQTGAYEQAKQQIDELGLVTFPQRF